VGAPDRRPAPWSEGWADHPDPCPVVVMAGSGGTGDLRPARDPECPGQ
jgi:hypothetical protein